MHKSTDKRLEVAMDNRLDDLAADVHDAVDDAVDVMIEPRNPFDFDEAEKQFKDDTILDQGAGQGSVIDAVTKPQLSESDTTTDDVNTTETISPDGTVTKKDLSVIKSQSDKYAESIATQVAKKFIRQYSEYMKHEEDIRANHRNQNRVMILTVALIGLFTIPILIEDVFQAPGLLKFSAAISVVPDFALTVYALIRKY